MTAPPDVAQWREANQRFLMAAVEVVERVLLHHAAVASGAPGGGAAEAEAIGAAQLALEDAARALPAPSALETLSNLFGLSAFERSILLLCAGVELDSTFGTADGNAPNGQERLTPTFGLAMAALPESHWSAASPTAPLRHWRLIEIGPGETLMSSPLRLDERVLHYLTGIPAFDERLRGLVMAVPAPGSLPPSHASVAGQIAGLWVRRDAEAAWPVVQLAGPDAAALRAAAAAAAAALGWQLYVLRAADVPLLPPDRDALAARWQREAVLRGGALLLDCEDADGPHGERGVQPLLEAVTGPVIVTGAVPVDIPARPTVRIEVGRLSVAEQRTLWQEALGELAAGLDGQIDAVSVQFALGTEAIRAAGAQVRASADGGGELPTLLWDACRAQARPRLDDLARRIEPIATWDDLVLPEAQRQTLRDILACVRQRPAVYESWGFGERSSRGLGVSALFSGSSGTGKTMAAEVIARELRLDLYHIDLSAVVSKYIGETEKNLRRVFDAAEEGGAVLLFDEADALFGKRSEVKDSHDRYANIEVSYLLQRMEAYRGLAVLTTNMKQALDPAFLRRLRFLVPFPFPDAAQRAEIWRRAFPPATPTEGLDPVRLAQLNVAGGNIRNIALTAAFLAADAGGPVRMQHVLRAARAEYAKLERPLTEAETSGWL